MPARKTINHIWDYLNEIGWSHDLVADNVIRAEYEGHFGVTKVMLHLHGEGLRIAINPIVAKPVAGWGRSVSGLVRTLGQERQVVNVGFDSEGDIYVKAEMAGDRLTFEQFVYVLFNLCQVSEQLMVPVLQAQAFDNLGDQMPPQELQSKKPMKQRVC